MKQDEIIEMAKEADKLSASKVDWDFEWIEIFAKLVAAKECEACAQLCDDIDLPFIASSILERGKT